MKETEFEKLCNIHDFYARMAAEVIEYGHNPTTVFSQERLAILETEHGKYHPNELTLEQAKNLGFRRWSMKSKLMLAPLWIVPYLTVVFEGADITEPDNVVPMNKHQLDNDSRYGCVAWGVCFDSLEIDPNAEE